MTFVKYLEDLKRLKTDTHEPPAPPLPPLLPPRYPQTPPGERSHGQRRARELELDALRDRIYVMQARARHPTRPLNLEGRRLLRALRRRNETLTTAVLMGNPSWRSRVSRSRAYARRLLARVGLAPTPTPPPAAPHYIEDAPRDDVPQTVESD